MVTVSDLLKVFIPIVCIMIGSGFCRQYLREFRSMNL